MLALPCWLENRVCGSGLQGSLHFPRDQELIWTTWLEMGLYLYFLPSHMNSGVPGFFPCI